jgi:DivIVA domain-containing protein
MDTGTPQLIEFSHRLRGYDPEEVNEYLAHLSQYAQQLEARAITAERALDEKSRDLTEARRRLAVEGGAEVPARLGQILGLANEEALEINERARAEARAMAELASRKADELLNEAAKERAEIERHVERLSATRAGFLSDLRQLSAQIAAAADHYEAHADTSERPDEAPTVFDGETDATTSQELRLDADGSGEDAEVEANLSP